MHLQDKIGRDLSRNESVLLDCVTNKEMMIIGIYHIINKTDSSEFQEIMKNDITFTANGRQAIKKLSKRKLIHFFSNGEHYKNKHQPSPVRGRLIYGVALRMYEALDIIDQDELERLLDMIYSPDDENLVIAESLIEIKYRPQWKKSQKRK